MNNSVWHVLCMPLNYNIYDNYSVSEKLWPVEYRKCSISEKEDRFSRVMVSDPMDVLYIRNLGRILYSKMGEV